MAYDNPAGVAAAAVILELLAVACVILRVYSRRKFRQQFIISDWLIILAMICATGLTANQLYGVSVKALAVPLNQSIGAADGERVQQAKYVEFTYFVVGIFALGLVKLSASFLFLKIFHTPRFMIVIKAWIWLLVIWTLAYELAVFLECGTNLMVVFGKFEDQLKYCGDAPKYIGLSYVYSNVFTDVITVALPIPMIWSLQMPISRKILAAGVFMVALLSGGASIAKSYIYIRAWEGWQGMDAIIMLTSIAVWNLVEVHVGIMAACSPTLRPILRELYPQESMTNLVNTVRSHWSRSHRIIGSSSSINTKKHSYEYKAEPKYSVETAGVPVRSSPVDVV